MPEPHAEPPMTGARSRSEPDRKSSTTTVAAIVGVIAVISALLPGFFFVAWLLGVIAIAAGLTTFRQGASADGFGSARVAVIAGALALVLGVINLGIVLDWFTYFTTGDASAPRSG